MLRPLAFICLLLLTCVCWAKPPSREEGERQQQVLADIKERVAAEPTDAAKIAAITQAMHGETDVDLRSRLLDLAKSVGAGREEFLALVLATDEDAGLRSQAATALGQIGSEKSLDVLAKAAASDRTTAMQISCAQATSNARRAATFAIAELANRFPKIADEAAARLRALSVAADPKDSEQLFDARCQSLYQVTHDETLIQPYFDRLKSTDAKEREDAVIAFRFLKLKKCPPEVAAELQESNPEVRSWAALVLGEIGDPASVKPLMDVAANTKLEKAVRCNAIGALGKMHAAAAADLMETLLSDTDAAVPANAAVALYRITGKKVGQFPEGYNAD